MILETNENKSTTIQNLRNAAKAVLRGKFIAIQSYLRNLKQLEKEEQTKPELSRRKEIIKIRAEISEIEKKKTIAKISETKS